MILAADVVAADDVNDVKNKSHNLKRREKTKLHTDASSRPHCLLTSVDWHQPVIHLLSSCGLPLSHLGQLCYFNSCVFSLYLGVFVSWCAVLHHAESTGTSIHLSIHLSAQVRFRVDNFFVSYGKA